MSQTPTRVGGNILWGFFASGLPVYQNDEIAKGVGAVSSTPIVRKRRSRQTNDELTQYITSFPDRKDPDYQSMRMSLLAQSMLWTDE